MEVNKSLNHSLEIDNNVVQDDAVYPFKIGKSTIDYIISKYLSRKLCEEVDYLHSCGGIRWIEDGLKTSIAEGLFDTEQEKVERINAYDSNEPPLEEAISILHLHL